jgi:cytochrome c
LFCQRCSYQPPRILVFYETKGWKHASIPAGIRAIQQLGLAHGFAVDTTGESSVFNEADLRPYAAVVFLSTTGNVLNVAEQNAFERYIQAGGGFAGIHSAAATEYDWMWYEHLLGAHFSSHPHNPGVRPGIVHVVDTTHLATRDLPATWSRKEEWYSYHTFFPGIHVLALLDEDTYEGGTNGSHHPIAWYHAFDGGRSFYTGLGHEDESYSDPLFLEHILGGIQYAMGKNEPLDYDKAYAMLVPEENRFKKMAVSGNLASPMELAIVGNGKVYFTELRSGKLQVYDPLSNRTSLVHRFAVNTAGGTGLIGVAVDPGFTSNHFIYLYYAPPEEAEPFHFRLSRFTLSAGDRLDESSEKILLTVEVQRNSGSHHGGSLAWDKQGNLYLSTGDSSSPFPSNGYAPLDERPGPDHYSLDAQRGPANTNDLKGKVLRIHPEPDGTYSIPDGNLFPQGTDKTRSEIYVMGCRNPYRIAVNPQTSTLYWGDIGPDAGRDSIQGPRGYDEFNQAREAGNFGWPYFIADNKAYSKWDFNTKTAGPPRDPAHPENHSPNNTGLETLPPAKPAMIWYPYAGSTQFPEFGSGGRSGMAGDFYKFKEGASDTMFPKYYDGALFVFDWMRNWVFALRFDDDERYLRSESFMPASGDFRRPIDLAFAPDGTMYMLEYGSVYGVDNEDARLVRITYEAGNRAPVAKAAIEDTEAYAALSNRVFLTSELKTLPVRKQIIGAVPLAVNFSGKSSADPDDDEISREWQLMPGAAPVRESNPKFTYEKSGTYPVVLTVKDSHGLTGKDTVYVVAGNAQPQVTIVSPDNKSFYWDGRSFRYQVRVMDVDGKVEPKRIATTLVSGPSKTALPAGYRIMTASDCKACHTVDKVSVGPSYKAIAGRYHNDLAAVDKLAAKIIAGGGGRWGTEHVMSAHPQLSKEDAVALVEYILSIDDFGEQSRPMAAGGVLVCKADRGRKVYTLTARYTDTGTAGQGPVSGTEVVTLRSADVPAVDVDRYEGFQRFRDNLAPGGHKSYLLMKNIDLTNIKAFEYDYASGDVQGEIEVRIDSYAGPVIARTTYLSTGGWDDYTRLQGKLDRPVAGRHDVYFIMVKRTKPNDTVIKMRTISFVL